MWICAGSNQTLLVWHFVFMQCMNIKSATKTKAVHISCTLVTFKSHRLCAKSEILSYIIHIYYQHLQLLWCCDNKCQPENKYLIFFQRSNLRSCLTHILLFVPPHHSFQVFKFLKFSEKCPFFPIILTKCKNEVVTFYLKKKHILKVGLGPTNSNICKIAHVY